MYQRRILIVDDDKGVLTILKISIERLLPDCQIIVVDDGATALTKLRQQPFDLILTDYDMPHMNGLALAQAARQISSDIPIVLMSGGYSCREIKNRAGSTALAGFLAKPFTMLQLREILQKNGI
ncbi:MAG: response regulator [Chloroflexota bacterium]